MPYPYRKAPMTKRKRYVKGRARPTVARQVKQVLNRAAETKKHSYEVIERNLNTLSSPAVEDKPIQLVQGVGNGMRVGHKITSVGMDIRGHVSHSGNSGTIYTRLFVLRKKNMVANPLNDLLEISSGANNSPLGDMETMWRRVNTDSYQVLASRTLKVGTTQDGENAKMFKIWVPYKGSFLYEGGSASSPKSNEIVIVAYTARADNDSAGSSGVEISYNTTFYYKDF